MLGRYTKEDESERPAVELRRDEFQERELKGSLYSD